MVCTTTLNASDLNRPTGDPELDRLLGDVRELTGYDLQVVSEPYMVKKRFLCFDRFSVSYRLALYKQVGGVFPYQELFCAKGKREVFAYLFGLFNGYTSGKGDTHE
jgi:hypothetical protein